MRIRVLQRSEKEHKAERKGDLAVVHRTVGDASHPFQREREYVRALNATKISKFLAKPFVAGLQGHYDGVSRVARHPALLPIICSGDVSGEVRAWDLSFTSCIGKIQAHKAEVTGVCFANTRRLLTCSLDRTIKS